MANDYFGKCYALCFSENRKGISRIYPKVEDFVQFIIIWLNKGIEIQMHLFISEKKEFLLIFFC